MKSLSKLFRLPTNKTSFLRTAVTNTGGLRPLREYTAIGFDVDHCLVRNNVRWIFPLLCNSLYKYFIHDKGYPHELFKFKTEDWNWFMNGLIIDMKTGNILKLGENKLVLRAYYGYKRLSQKEIEEAYGSPPIYSIFNVDRMRTDDYFCCMTFFECYFPLVFAKMVEYKRNGKPKLSEAEIKELLNDANYAISKNYDHFNEDLYRSISTFGYYYKGVLDNIENCLFKHNRMLDALETLKRSNKVLFLMSNSHYEFVEKLMNYSYGDKWKNLFDLTLVNMRKGKFFSAKSKRPFRVIDLKKENRLGEEVYELNSHQMYTDGNVELLEKNIRRIANDIRKGRILYIGDNYAHDVLAPKKLEGWDTVCIMEELGGWNIGDNYDGSVWGHWQYEKTPHGLIPTFWYSEMSSKANKCTPMVDSDEMIDFYYQDAVEEEYYVSHY